MAAQAISSPINRMFAAHMFATLKDVEGMRSDWIEPNSMRSCVSLRVSDAYSYILDLKEESEEGTQKLSIDEWIEKLSIDD